MWKNRWKTRIKIFYWRGLGIFHPWFSMNCQVVRPFWKTPCLGIVLFVFVLSDSAYGFVRSLGLGINPYL